MPNSRRRLGLRPVVVPLARSFARGTYQARAAGERVGTVRTFVELAEQVAPGTRIGLDADDPTVGSRQDDVDLRPVAVAPVVERHVELAGLPLPWQAR